MLKPILVTIAVVLVIGAIAVTFYVEREAEFSHEVLAAKGRQKALVLYHPSRDAGFSDEVSLAVGDGFKDAGLSVDRETMTETTAARPQGYAVIAVVSNTFWATPDWPTVRYLRRANMNEIPVIGLICGAGSTDRSQRKLELALRTAGAHFLGTRPFWIFRPNDDARVKEPNRQVALEMARGFGYEMGRAFVDRSTVPAAASVQ